MYIRRNASVPALTRTYFRVAQCHLCNDRTHVRGRGEVRSVFSTGVCSVPECVQYRSVFSTERRFGVCLVPGGGPECVQYPGEVQSRTDCVQNRSVFSPGVMYRSVFSPGVMYRSVFSPGVMYRSVFSPGVMYRSVFSTGVMHRTVFSRLSPGHTPAVLRSCAGRSISLTSQLGTKPPPSPGSGDGQENISEPIRFSTSKASHRTWKVERSMGSRFQRPWWQVLPLSFLTIGFLLWCVFREESDIDRTLEKQLFEHLPGLLSNIEEEEEEEEELKKEPDDGSQ